MMSMPPDCNDTAALRRVLCKEACLLVKDHLCYEEWRRIESLKESGILSTEIVIPDCNMFPSIKQSSEDQPCSYPDLFYGNFHLSSFLEILKKNDKGYNLETSRRFFSSH